jgi:hypothetical protein
LDCSQVIGECFWHAAGWRRAPWDSWRGTPRRVRRLPWGIDRLLPHVLAQGLRWSTKDSGCLQSRSLLRVCVGRQKIRVVWNRDHCSGFALVDKRFGLFAIEITAQGLRWSTKDSGCLQSRSLLRVRLDDKAFRTLYEALGGGPDLVFGVWCLVHHGAGPGTRLRKCFAHRSEPRVNLYLSTSNPTVHQTPPSLHTNKPVNQVCTILILVLTSSASGWSTAGL